MGKWLQRARLGARTGATVRGGLTLWLGLPPLVFAPTGCAVHHYHPILGDRSGGTAAPPPLRREPLPLPPANAGTVAALSPVQYASRQAEEPAPQPRPVSGAPAGKNQAATPTLAAGASVTFDQAINATLLADPKIRAGLEAINQANADLLTSSLAPNPTLIADAQLLPLTRPFTVDRQGGPPQTDYPLSYPIAWF